ncbi:MAG: PDZ domain-containing protein, partial [Planctomycetota bacterium]
LYFISDRDEAQRNNLWAFDTHTGTARQVTSYRTMDIHFASIGPDDIVYENAGKLWRLPLLASGEGQPVEVSIRVVADYIDLRPRVEKVGDGTRNASITPAGARIVAETRGELFSVPAEHGVVRNLTRSSGVAERWPAVSPDGTRVAYFSDRSGEYELVARPLDGDGDETRLTAAPLNVGFGYQPQWSPDGKTIVFVDKAMRMHRVDVATGAVTQLDKGYWMYHGELSRFAVTFSADSRWIVWSRGLENAHDAIFAFDSQTGATHQLTSGFYNDTQPAFDPDGKYLYWLSDRTHSPMYGRVADDWIYANATNVLCAPLRTDVPSPLRPRNDDDATKAEPKDGKDEKPPASPAVVSIDVSGFESRAITLPMAAGNYNNLRAVRGKLLVIRGRRTGESGGNSPLVAWELKDRAEKEVLDNANDFEVSGNGKKLLVRRGSTFSIIDPAPKQAFKALGTAGLEMTVDPREEWRQLFAEAWRLQRDYFYDPGMHGSDWAAMRARYEPLLAHCVTRWDVNHVIGELIGEINSSHTYRGGGDTREAPGRAIGMLGCDYELANGHWRIRKIIRGAAWDAADERSPLAEPGCDVSEGDYLLAVNGEPVRADREPYAALDGLANKTVELTVNSQPAAEGARRVLVQPMGSEFNLRYRAWIEVNRKRVDDATNGRVGYCYIPNTGGQGQNELVRQFRAQFNKEAIIFDERWNGGGQIPDRFIELINRPVINYWAVRDGRDWQTPGLAHDGPKCMLINGRAGSGGDAFPHYFRERGLGPLIGTRTWGGLIGYTGVPRLLDGGNVTVPSFGIYDRDGKWIIEGTGVSPDIEVQDDPSKMWNGGDPQLDTAIMVMLRALEQGQGAKRPAKPAYPDRHGK